MYWGPTLTQFLWCLTYHVREWIFRSTQQQVSDFRLCRHRVNRGPQDPESDPEKWPNRRKRGRGKRNGTLRLEVPVVTDSRDRKTEGEPKPVTLRGGLLVSRSLFSTVRHTRVRGGRRRRSRHHDTRKFRVEHVSPERRCQNRGRPRVRVC